jgi:hypothetical protein
MNGRGFEEMTISILTFNNGSMIMRVVYSFPDLLLESFLPYSGGPGKEPIETLTFDFRGLDVGV